ncbi:hypothetical protein ES707_09375 [subsurface metagenome]
MIYIVVRGQTEDEQRTVCIVKAKNKDDALKMVGVDTNITTWAGFSDDDISTIVDTNEGYISSKL